MTLSQPHHQPICVNVPVELAMIMDRLYGGVCYAGIDTDPELKYPKGAGRVAFSNQQSYIAAISARFVQLQHGEIDKRVSQSGLWYFSGATHILSRRKTRDLTRTIAKLQNGAGSELFPSGFSLVPFHLGMFHLLFPPLSSPCPPGGSEAIRAG